MLMSLQWPKAGKRAANRRPRWAQYCICAAEMPTIGLHGPIKIYQAAKQFYSRRRKDKAYRQRQWKAPEPPKHNYRHFSAAASGRNFLTVALQGVHSYFNSLPHPMPSNTGASILDDALDCIGQRIASILIQPADKDKSYITSLHNEVVGVSQR
jgi:hypothetical protein